MNLWGAVPCNSCSYNRKTYCITRSDNLFQFCSLMKLLFCTATFPFCRGCCTTDWMQADYIFKMYLNVLLKKIQKCLFYTDPTCITIQIITLSYKMYYNQPKQIVQVQSAGWLLWKQSQHHWSHHTHTQKNILNLKIFQVLLPYSCRKKYLLLKWSILKHICIFSVMKFDFPCSVPHCQHGIYVPNEIP